MLDHPVCADTAGRFLMTGLRDGSVNINNLMVCVCGMHECRALDTCYAMQVNTSPFLFLSPNLFLCLPWI